MPLVDGATAFGQLLLYGQATSVPDQQDAVIPNSSKLVDNQYLFRDMLDADLITPQQAQQARSHEAPVYPEECGLQHYVPTSPRPRVVPQFLLERPNSRVPTQHGHTHVYGHRDTVPSARPMPLQVLPAPTHMATRPPSFAYNQPSSNANGHPTPTCRTPTAPASRGRGGGAGVSESIYSLSHCLCMVLT